MKSKKVWVVFFGILLFLGAGVRSMNATENPQEKTEFTAFVVNMGGVVKTSGTARIVIDRWSTPDERNGLIAAFQSGGQDELLKVLKKSPKVGFIAFPKTLAYDLRYAYQWPAEDGGRTIVIATDRRITPGEVWDQTRSMDYPFELIQMKLNAEGKGNGVLAWAVKIQVSKDGTHLELEKYSTHDVMLNNVEMKIKKPKEPKEPK